MQNNIVEVWGFSKIALGGAATAGGKNWSPASFMEALGVGAQDRGIDPNVPSDALDASRDCIIDDVVFGVGSDRRPGAAWEIKDDTIYVVSEGMSLESLMEQ